MLLQAYRTGASSIIGHGWRYTLANKRAAREAGVKAAAARGPAEHNVWLAVAPLGKDVTLVALGATAEVVVREAAHRWGIAGTHHEEAAARQWGVAASTKAVVGEGHNGGFSVLELVRARNFFPRH